PAKGAIELQRLAVHDLPLLVADGEGANLLGDLVQPGLESRRARVRSGVLAEHRPHAADLALDVLGGRIEGLNEPPSSAATTARTRTSRRSRRGGAISPR